MWRLQRQKAGGACCGAAPRSCPGLRWPRRSRACPHSPAPGERALPSLCKANAAPPHYARAPPVCASCAALHAPHDPAVHVSWLWHAASRARLCP